jgi:hypothetical protein
VDPAALALAALVWHGSTDVAVGRAELGPWQMNESRWDYVDDATVALDERGGIAVAWVDQGEKDVFFRRFSAPGKPLGEAVNVSRSPKIFSWLPRIALDASGRVFVLWQEIIFSGGSHGGEILFARSEDGGRTFSPPLNLSNSRAGDGKGRITAELWHNGSLDLAAGNDGTLYAAWTEYEGALWVRRSSDAGKTFSAALKIPDAKPARAPSLAVSNRTVYLAWTVGDDASADIRVAKSTDGGASFSAPRIAERSKRYSDAPKLALDARGTLHLVYVESESGLFGRRHVRYTRSQDGGTSFAPSRDISERGAAFPALDIDAKGNLYVLWERFADHALRSRGLALAVSNDQGRTFSAPVLVPGSTDGGWNGSLQGMLMRKLAVNGDGVFAIVNSSVKEKEASRVRLIRGQLQPR